MRSYVKEITDFEPAITYPCLKRSTVTGVIVLFSDAETGTVIHSAAVKGSSYAIGDFGDGWDETCFLPFLGSVTLKD